MWAFTGEQRSLGTAADRNRLLAVGSMTPLIRIISVRPFNLKRGLEDFPANRAWLATKHRPGRSKNKGQSEDQEYPHITGQMHSTVTSVPPPNPAA